MATIQLPTEFSELLKLLNAHEVKYLIVGGYAVAYHGYPRTTGNIDIWIESTESNGKRIVAALAEFGFNVPALRPALFTRPDQIIRMGHPPLRVELLTSISGVDFSECYRGRTRAELGGVATTLIGLDCLKKNKRASGRHKDLDDLEHLP